MAPKCLVIPRSSNSRIALLLRNSGPYDAFFENQVSVESSLSGRDDRKATSHPRVECEALDSLQLRGLGFVARQQAAEFGEDRHLTRRVVHDLHVKRRARYELIEGHEREHRFRDA